MPDAGPGHPALSALIGDLLALRRDPEAAPGRAAPSPDRLPDALAAVRPSARDIEAASAWVAKTGGSVVDHQFDLATAPRLDALVAVAVAASADSRSAATTSGPEDGPHALAPASPLDAPITRAEVPHLLLLVTGNAVAGTSLPEALDGRPLIDAIETAFRTQEFRQTIGAALVDGAIPNYRSRRQSEFREAWTWFAERAGLPPLPVPGRRAALSQILAQIPAQVSAQSLDVQGAGARLERALGANAAAIRAAIDAPGPDLLGMLTPTRPLRLEGWICDPAAPDRALVVQLFANGEFITEMTANLFSRETEEVIGHERCGFRFLLSDLPRLQAMGRCVLRLVEARSGLQIDQPQTVEIDPRTVQTRTVDAARTLATLERTVQDLRRHIPPLSSMAAMPRSRYWVLRDLHPVPSVPDPDRLAEIRQDVAILGAGPEAATTLQSLAAQSHPTWRATLVDLGRPAAGALPPGFHRDPRMRVVGAASWTGPARGSDRLVCVPAGVWLHPHALAWIAEAHERAPASLSFADHEEMPPETPDLSVLTEQTAPVLKPVFDLDLYLTTGYLGPVVSIPAASFPQRAMPATETVQGAGAAPGTAPGTAPHTAQGAGPAPEAPEHAALAALLLAWLADHPHDPPVVHLPQCLSRCTTGQVQAPPLPALQRFLDRTVQGAQARPHQDRYAGAESGLARIDWPVRAAEPIDVIIPTRNRHDLLRTCLDSLWATCARPRDLRVTIIDNGSDDDDTLAYLRDVEARRRGAVLRDESPFNWAALNNRAVERTGAPLLLFLNNDTESITGGWDDHIRAALQRPDVAALGARLLYRDGSLQDTGILLNPQTVATHQSASLQPHDPVEFSISRVAHGVTAVSGAFLAVRRDTFLDAGRFDEALPVAFNDVDFCVRLRAANRRVIYQPDIVFYHDESKSRLHDHLSPQSRTRLLGEGRIMRERWPEALAHDPYYNPQLTRAFLHFTSLVRPLTADATQDHLRRQAESTSRT